MADNIQIKDALAANTTLKTTEDGSLHTPHHNVDAMPATAAEGGALPAKFVVVAGDDGTDVHPLQVDSAGYLRTVSAESETSAGEGAALPSKFTVIAGDDGTGSPTYPLQIDDSTGGLKVRLQANTGVDIGDVDVLSSALPTGAATAANQAAANTDLAAMEVLSTAANALLTTIDSDTNDIKAAVEIIDNAISGSEMQVDVVAALPAGDNNIGNVDVVSVTLPTTGFTGITAYTHSGGVAVQLAASGALKSGVTVKAYSGNAAAIFVGFSNVTATTSGTNTTGGIELAAKESVFIEVDSLSDVYIRGGADGLVTYIGT